MAHMAAKLKMGFYPAPEPAIDEALTYLEAPKKGNFAILDPCCGMGEAIEKIAEGLGCKPENIYACELDESRGSTAAAKLEGGNVVHPADFLSVAIPSRSISFAWVNPPFEDEIGGGSRVETAFLDKATKALRAGGIMAFVCPEKTAKRWDVRELFKSWFDDLHIVPFPPKIRKYGEVIMFARKRSEVCSPYLRPGGDEYWHKDESDPDAPDWPVYQIPKTKGPGERFYKVQLTDMEIIDELYESPLRARLNPAVEPDLPSPPLELAKGHLALLLIGGYLDGLVCPPDEPPHVVRGTVSKQDYIKEQTSEVDKGGNVNTKTVVAERMVRTVRAVSVDGVIRTFTEV